MSIKVLANKVLAFDRGEKDRNGVLIQEKTKIGFNELPDWVEHDDYFKAAKADGSLTAFNSAAESEDVLKAQEKLAAIQEEIKAEQEKLDLLKAQAAVKPDVDKSVAVKSADNTGENSGAPADPGTVAADDKPSTDGKTAKNKAK